MAFEENVPLPKINKIPFIAVDVALIIAALIIRFSVATPLSPFNAFIIAGCVAIGGFVAFLPFYVEFRTLAKLKEYDLSQANTENARRIESAMMGIQEIGEAVVQSTDRNSEICGAFETLLERMESRIKEIKAGGGGEASLDPKQLKEALGAQFESAREDFAMAIAEQVAMTSDKQHDKLNSALSKLQGLPMQVSLLGDLASRYQGLMAMMQDTAAQLVESTPAKPVAKMEVEEALEGSLDGVLDEEDEENVAPETAAIVEHEVADEDELEDYDEEIIDGEDESEEEEVEVIDELIEVDEEEPVEEVTEETEEAVAEAGESSEETEDFVITTSLPEEDEEHTVDGEDFSQMDARFEEELEKDAEPEDGAVESDEKVEGLDEELSDEEPADTEPEFLTDEDLAEDESDAMPEMSEAALAELEEEDFDIALSDDLVDPEESTAESESEEKPTEESVLTDAEVTGMGFDDWDEFGDIATEESAAAEEAGEAPEDEPEQGELIDEAPAEAKSKPKKQRGATTLIAQVLIGIGNKPYVRGTGPGLSMDEGVPMEFLEIGKWQWTAPSSDEPVTVMIYKNDEDPAEGDPIEIPAGQRRSIAPKFPK